MPIWLSADCQARLDKEMAASLPVHEGSPLVADNLDQHSQLGTGHSGCDFQSSCPRGDVRGDDHSSGHSDPSRDRPQAPALAEDSLLSTLAFVSGNMLELYDVSYSRFGGRVQGMCEWDPTVWPPLTRTASGRVGRSKGTRSPQPNCRSEW